MSPNIGLYYFPKVDSKVVLSRNFSFIGTLSAVLVIGIFIIHPSILTMLMYICVIFLSVLSVGYRPLTGLI